jgi:putative MATE family efflux protein
MKDFTTGNIPRQIYKFTAPIILGSFFQQLYNIVDSIVVGNYVGQEALAAVGASFPIIFLLISLAVGVSNGATIIISQFYGAKDYAGVQRAIDTSNIFLFFASIVISGFGIYFSEDIFRLINMPEEAMSDAVTYLSIYLAGLSGLFGFYGLGAILRGLGDSKTPLYTQLIAAVANIGLDLLFVIVFEMGVAGVALATVLAQGGTFIGLAIYLNRKHKLIRVTIRNMVFDTGIFKHSLRIGLPSGLQQSFVGLGMMAIIGIVNKFGTEAVAAYTVASRIDMLAVMPAMNFAQGLSTFVGQNIGANNISRVKLGFRATMVMSIALSVVICLLIIIFGGSLMSMFTDNENIIAIGNEYLVIVSSFYVCFAVMFTSNGALRGAGDTVVPMFITLFSLWAIRIPLSYFLSEQIGVTGIWWGIPVAWVIGMVLSYAYYKTGRWERMAVVRRK